MGRFIVSWTPPAAFNLTHWQSFDTLNPVSRIFNGPQIRSSMMTSNGCTTEGPHFTAGCLACLGYPIESTYGMFTYIHLP